MGAMAPTPQWTTEDDLLLKNAVEAGASLESLAKGAVQFSRRFTVRELRERWHSILYDPVVSDEASSRMTEFEHCASTLPSKSNRFGNSKDNKVMPSKRKSESVRKRYHAMRKRISDEPFNSMDLSFLIAPSNSNFDEDGDEPLSVNCILENPITNPFGLEESNLGVMRDGFSEMLSVDGTDIEGAASIFHTELPNPAEENFHIDRQHVHGEIIGAGMSLPSSSGHEELGQEPKDQPMCLFEADGSGGKLGSTLDSYAVNKLGEEQVLNSPIKDCNASFHNLEFSAPLPDIPIWKEADAISEPVLPVDVGDRENDLQTGDIFALPDNGCVMDTSELGYMDNQEGYMDNQERYMNNQEPFTERKSDNATTEGYLEVLSNSLMDFTNDDEILLMEDGKDVIGKFFKDGLGSLLLTSPADASKGQVPSISEPMTSVGLGTYLMDPSSTCLGKLCNNNEPQYSVGHAAEAEMLSPSLTSNLQFPELCDGIICCTLNTEDPEIPCNDDVIFHKHLPSSPVPHAAEQSPPCIGIQSSSGNQKPSERVSCLMQMEDKTPRHVSSQAIESRVFPEMCRNQAVVDCGVKSEFHYNDTQHMVSTRTGIAGGCPNQNNAGNVASIPATTMEEITKITLAKHPGHYSNGCLTEKPYFEEFAPPEPVVNSSTADQEELAVESDDDLSYFSDVEAMILEMDLDPDDLDLDSSEKVSKYQHEDTRRAIIRLEQGFHACMKREIAFHGAFAVLIGRQTKYYIRKDEVLLGRATEDVVVDIDLGREVCANKISRRQAIIKMDKGGSFFLKNLGKCPISLNNKEIACGQSLSLFSSSLIEIRGMPFMFEINEGVVKRFLKENGKQSNDNQ